MNNTDHKKLLATFRYWVLGKASENKEYYKVLKALTLAEKYHNGKRKGGDPEFSHQISICSYIRTIHAFLIDAPTVFTVAILHDLYEDYPESYEEIKTMFPDELIYVIRVSKIRKGEKISYDLYFNEMKECHICSVVKLADRIANLSTMVGVFSYDKQTSYILELDDWFFPMLKHSKRKFPEQEPAYENMKSFLFIIKDTILKMRESFKDFELPKTKTI